VSFREVPIDRVRAYWNRRPCNVRHSPAPVGTKEYFDEVEKRKYFVEPHIPAFADFLRWHGKRVLEIGCGIGTDTINFARNGATVTAVDLSEESLALARRRAEVFDVADRITFQWANAEELPDAVPVEQFDLVYSFGVIHHTPNPERVLEHARSYLGEGGTLKLMMYNRWSWKVIAIVLRSGKGRIWRARQLVAEHSEAQFGSPVTYTYSRRELRRLLEQRGFRVENMFVDHIFSWRIRDYVEYRYVRAWPFRALPRPLFRRLERLFGWHLCATAVKEAST
jgi:2-polyprenyl-3-methyl-5-hydroxy-6-metoxy-1,4-benzoquinol methylase